MKREFLMLAHDFRFGRYLIGSWFLSEKLDGQRCYWDGGISRGIKCKEIPWANIEKHHRFVNEPISTGLWTRYGQVIRAPDFWLDELPKFPLDGELTMGRGTWQETSSCIKQHHPDVRWDKVQYLCFDSPNYGVIFRAGKINNTNFKKVFNDCDKWCYDRAGDLGELGPFYRINRKFQGLRFGKYAKWHEQIQLDSSFVRAEQEIKEHLTRIESLGGEGLILRDPGSEWVPERTNSLLKVKSERDMEGTVVGYKFGKPTDLDRSISGNETNKLLGMMGSLILQLDSGKTFDLSGFTEAERQLSDPDFAKEHAGEVAPNWITNPNFPRGSRVTFKYRELSGDGIPKEARYWRK